MNLNHKQMKKHDFAHCASSNCRECQEALSAIFPVKANEDYFDFSIRFAKEWAKENEKILDYVKTESDKNIGKNGV